MNDIHHTTSVWILGGLLLLAACGHDAKRDNPLDPVLTPPVELAVAIDDTAGTALLTWTPYDGEQPFAEYRVLRKVSGLEQVDTLFVSTDLTSDSFVDSVLAQNTTYEYRILTVNEGGLEVSSPAQLTPPLNLLSVDVTNVIFRSASGTATIEWSPYRGPHFHAYQILRSSAGSQPQLVGVIEDSTRTTFVDSGVHGNTDYSYRMVVRNALDEEIVGNEYQVRSFHELLTTWPIEIEDGDYVRLDFEGEDLVALHASPNRIRVITFDSHGALLREETVHEIPISNCIPISHGGHCPPPYFDPRSVDTVRLPDGRRFVSLKSDGTPWLMAFEPDGAPIGTETAISDEALEPYIEQYIEPSDANNLFYFFSNIGTELRPGFWTGNTRVFDGNSDVADDAEIERSWIWDSNFAAAVDGWDGWFATGLVARGDSSWHHMRAEMDVVIEYEEGTFGSLVSTSVPRDRRDGPRSRDFEETSLLDGELHLFIRPQDSSSSGTLAGLHFEIGQQSDRNEILIPREFLRGATYRLGIDHTNGFRAYLIDPALWTSSVQGLSPWTALAPARDRLVLVGAGAVQSLEDDGDQPRDSTPFSFSASQLRTWEEDGDDLVGVCLPELNQIRVQRVNFSFTNFPDWPDDDGVVKLGPIGSGDGEFISPLSFDVGPDGRFFVVDAGNRRIQVMDRDGNHLTSWGRKGNGEGEFDFGDGLSDADFFAGNVAVDGEGFIYVADVGNKRIQKFAP